MAININEFNVGITGGSGEGKSYFFEHEIFPKLNKCILIIDVKNQYTNIKKEDYRIYFIRSSNPVKEYYSIIDKVKLSYMKGKFKFIIIWQPENIYQGEFDRIVKHWAELGNNTLILEECHEFRYSKLKSFDELEKTLRKRTGKHNKNINVIWLTQFPQDLPRDIYGNTQVLIMFNQWDNIFESLKLQKRIPDNVINPESKSFKYIVVNR